MNKFLDIIKFVSENRGQFCNFLEDPNNPKYGEIKKKSKSTVMRAIKNLEQAIEVNDSNSNMHFYLGILMAVAGESKEAVQCFVNAIDKSDDNYFNHYYWKGVALAAAECYELAIGELDTAKNIDKTRPEASMQMGICYLIAGDLDNAYEAFKAVVGCPKNELEVNYNIGKFFMSRGFMQHAIHSFHFALKNTLTEKVLQELLKCFIHEKNLVSAMDTLQKLEELGTSKKNLYQFDLEILQILKGCCEGKEVWAIEKLASIEQSKKEGFVFKRFEVLLYQATTYFLVEDYQNCLKVLTLLELDFYGKAGDSLLTEQEEDCFNIMFVDSTDREGQYYITTKSVTRPEIVYNMAVCQLMLKNFDRGYLKLCSLIQIPQIGLKVVKLMAKIKRNVSAETQAKAKTTTLMSSNNEFDMSGEDGLFTQLLMDSPDQMDSEATDFNPFPTENRLCSIYPTKELEVSPGESIDLRLSFCLPAIQITGLEIKVGFEELLTINLRSIEYKPEAPWIKKVDDKIIFTNHLIQEEVAEFEDPEAVLANLKQLGNVPVNSLIKINIQQAYNHNLELQKAALARPSHANDKEDDNYYGSMDDQDGEEEEAMPDLARLKQELMLDDRTNELLSRLAK